MMTFEQFKEGSKEIKRQYKAVCYSQNTHWQAKKWRDSYTQAYLDAQGHMNEKPGNDLHEIKIVERIYSETTIT